MATVPVREYSLDCYLLEKLRFSGLEKDNLADLELGTASTVLS